MRIGIVLSSGGVRGVFAHTGFLLGLQDLDITYKTVAGCSAGAIVGGIVASGTRVADWSEALAGATSRDFWRPDPVWKILWRMVARRGRGYTGFSSVEPAIAFCRKQLAVSGFEDCPYPFRSLALSLGRNRKVVFSSGELAPRMVASAAVPVLYRPVEIDGEFYCDGAVVEFGPIDTICCDQELDLVILHHVAVHREGVELLRSSLQAPWALGRIVDWIVYRQHPWYVSGNPISFHRCPSGCGTPIAVLEPTLPMLPWGTTDGGQAIQQAAEQQTVDMIKVYREQLLSDPSTLTKDSARGPEPA